MTIDFTAWPWNALPEEFVIQLSENLVRKNYTEFDLAIAQDRTRKQLKPLCRQGYRSDLQPNCKKASKHSSKSTEKKCRRVSRSLDRVIAKAFGESHEIVRQRRKVSGWTVRCPKRYGNIRNQLIDDSLAISAAYNLIARDIKKREIMSTAPKIELPEHFRLHLADFSSKRVLKIVPPNSIDMIFTDPPYDKASLVLYSRLAKLAANVLKEGACLVFYAGQYYLPEIMNIFAQEKSLSYVWMGITINSGHNARIYQKRVFCGYKPLLIYVKGDKRACDDFFPDVIASKSKAPEKILHPWEQKVDEAEHFIRYLTYEGQIVLDPMLGTGTTGIATAKLRRKFIGIDKDKDAFRSAKAKIAHWMKSNNHMIQPSTSGN